MKTKKMILPIVCCIPFLGSCTSPQTTRQEIMAINPVYRINQTTDSPDALYQLGRYYQGQQRYEQATAAYNRALAADSDLVEAHNGLGVIYAMQGRYEEAITAFRKAISLAPTAAHLYNNLGHTFYLQGAYAEAASTLEQAATLDPTNSQTLSNLGLALAKTGEPGKTTEANIAAAATPRADKAQSTPFASAARIQAPQLQPRPQSSEIAMAAPAATAKSRLETVQLAPNIYELRERNQPAQIATAQASAAPAVKPAISAPLRLEVTNGNGVTGFAKKISGFLGNQGYRTARLTNQKPFQVLVSQIQYRPGYQDEAQRLKSSLSGDLKLVQTSQLRADIQARLLLGKDMTGDMAQFESSDRKILVASNASTSSGLVGSTTK